MVLNLLLKYYHQLLTIQFIVELLIVAAIALIIGAVIGGFLAKPVGNMLLENEIETTQSEQQQISENFGKGGKENRPEMKFNSREQVETIDSIEAVVDFTVIIQLLGIGILLTLMSSLASMISIQRFSPLTILKERS